MVRTHVNAAGAAAVIPLLDGPVRDGAVVGAFSRAVIISVGTPEGPRVLSLLAPRAAGMPNGVRLSADDAVALTRPVPGEAVSVGTGRILLDGLEVRVVRSWPCRARRVCVDRRSIDTIADLAAARPSGVPAECVAALRSALSTDESAARSAPTSAPAAPAARIPLDADDALRAAARGLVGRGLGLTPGGDDVIAGALCGLHATGATGGVHLLAAAALENVTEQTTLLSADLLKLAAAGDACLEVLAVLRAAHHPRDVLRPNHSALAAAIDRLLRVGHTSGADLATGLAVGLRAGAHLATRERAEVG